MSTFVYDVKRPERPDMYYLREYLATARQFPGGEVVVIDPKNVW